MFEHIKKHETIALLVIAILFLIGVGLDLADQPIYEKYRGYLLALTGIMLLFFLVPAVIRCASDGVSKVWMVVRVSALLLIMSLIIFYISFFWIVSAGVGGGFGGVEKVLNFPPVIAALWGAGMGWYIHFQASAKNHRTTNSFNLLMQTRTSAEFLRRASIVQEVYPHGHPVDEGDSDKFSTSSLRDLLTKKAALESKGQAISPALENDLRLVAALDSLKYLLNYYEFMAVGIEAKDLEESLLYNTIGVNVTSLYERASVFIDFIRDPKKGNQPLAFQSLKSLVEKWNKQLKDELHEQN